MRREDIERTGNQEGEEAGYLSSRCCRTEQTTGCESENRTGSRVLVQQGWMKGRGQQMHLNGSPSWHRLTREGGVVVGQYRGPRSWSRSWPRWATHPHRRRRGRLRARLDTR